ncbi:MAG: hypothetical protein EOM55_02985 [Clostridia bacterium]|nr:hypothetical protein [Clostridia bacterium]
MEERNIDEAIVNEQVEKNDEKDYRQEQLGFYGQYPITQYKTTPLAFSVLQREVGNEIILFSKNHYKPNTVIKFKDDVDRNQFQIASKYFEGRRFKDFIGFLEELSNKNFDEFWQSVADEEKTSIEDHLSEILNMSSLCEKKRNGLINHNLSSKITSKIYKYNIKSLETEMEDLSYTYLGICDLYKIWISMTKNEQKQYVAKRYLSTGSIDFNPNAADKYAIKSVRNNDKLYEEKMDLGI